LRTRASVLVRDLVLSGEAELTTGPFGTQLKASEYVAAGVPLINVRNIGFGEVRSTDLEYLSEKTAVRLGRHRLETGDIVFGRKGAVERHAYISKDHVGWVQGSDCLRLRLRSSRFAPRFVSYFLLTEHHKQWMKNYCSGGATMASLNQDILSRIALPLVPLPVQFKIVGVLSAYDDLIENNNRRIKVLEEMPSRIYREWFVDFRYPDNEGVPLVDSELGPIPRGWSVKRMDEVADVIDCLHSKKPESTEGGTGILLQLFNIGAGGSVDLSQIFRISGADYEQWTSRIELGQGDCVVTNVGRIAAVAQIPRGLKAAPGRNMTAIRPRAIPPTFLLQYLLSEHMDHEVQTKKDAGSIMDSLNVKGIVKLAVQLPGDVLANQFEQLVRPIRRHMELLISDQQNLRTTRDLLLPRLISGEIDVTDLDIAMPEAAA
jgi:type I restriction enzyme S subunit